MKNENSMDSCPMLINGRHFPDDIFKWIFVNENAWISINISLKFVPKSPINNIPTFWFSVFIRHNIQTYIQSK